MDKILALWAVPRSTSTAFEWMMRVRGDFECLHEPFGEVWYQGENPLWPRVTQDSLRTPGLTYESCWENLQKVSAHKAVFIKDFPLYLEPVLSDEFLGNFRHSFLIRDPLKTLSSMYEKWPDFHEKEIGFIEQRQLFDHLCELDGNPPPVIDSDDLLENPFEMVKLWCEAVDISFIPKALSWTPGPRDEVSWWDGGSFHENLRKSDGLKKQPRKEISIEDAPERVKEVYQVVRPHYEHLAKHRIASKNV